MKAVEVTREGYDYQGEGIFTKQFKQEVKPMKEKNGKTDENLDELQQVSVKIITEHLRDEKHEGPKVDFALRGLTAISRLKATARAKDATQYMILRDISTNPEEFKKYVAVSLPHLNPIKEIAS